MSVQRFAAWVLFVGVFSWVAYGQTPRPSDASQSDQVQREYNPCAPTAAQDETGQGVVTGRPQDMRQGGVVPDCNDLERGEYPGMVRRGVVPGEAPARIRTPVLPSEPEERNEFQQFVSYSVGRQLPMFGYNLFRNVPTTFAPVDHVPVTANYVVGPGDELLIRAWGQIDMDYRGTVDRDGKIYVPRVGDISVAGIKSQELQGYLRDAIGRVFRNFDLSVSLGHLRSIQVFVVGQARRPGSYTISSLSTLVNALFASGGPSTKGSMRRIQLKRGNHVVTEFDLYDLLVSGDMSKDLPLASGDVIFIPAIGDLVAVSGSVNVPAIYETKGETTLSDLIKLAGGLTTTAGGQKVTVERINDQHVRTVAEFPLDSAGLDKPVQNGDLINVLSLSPRFENAVTLRGSVALQGRFPWHTNMRVRDLIPNRQALITPDYWMRQNAVVTWDDTWLERRGPRLRRRSPTPPLTSPSPSTDRTNQQPTDRLSTASAPEFYDGRDGRDGRDGSDSSVSRRDSRDRSLEASERQRHADALEDELRRNSAHINWDYALIQRLNPDDLSMRLIPFNLGEALKQPDSESNLLLQPGDIITILSASELDLPVEKRDKFVRLEGEVAVPGIYKVGEGETLRELVEKVGGLTPGAYLFGAEFTRESTRKLQQEKLDLFVTELQREVQHTASIRAQNFIRPEDAATFSSRLELQRAAIEQLRQLKPKGRVVLGIKPWQDSANSLPDMALEDGDRFFVPFRPAVVNIVGSVYNQNAFLYRPSRHISEYLREAGGQSPDADMRRIYVIHADGSIVSKARKAGWFTGGFGNEKLLPGDTIVVPQRFDKRSFLSTLRDWSQVMAQFGLGAAAINVLK